MTPSITSNGRTSTTRPGAGRRPRPNSGRALSLNPYRPDWHFNLGLTLEQTGRFDEAATAFQKAHDLDPDAQSANCVGLNFLRAERPKDAVSWFDRAQKLSPEDSASFVHRIEAYAQMGDHDQAEVMFYMAQQVNPKDALAYATLADSLLDRGLHDKAVWCLREAAHLDAALPRIHARLAQAYAATGRLERARQLYLRELRQDPGDIDTLMELGCLLVDMNRLGEAGEKFRRMLELEPDNPTAHYHLADLAVRLGQHAEALAQFDVVLRLDNDFVGARRQVARLLLKRDASGDANSAREMLAAELAMSREQEIAVHPRGPGRARPPDAGRQDAPGGPRRAGRAGGEALGERRRAALPGRRLLPAGGPGDGARAFPRSAAAGAAARVGDVEHGRRFAS